MKRMLFVTLALAMIIGCGGQPDVPDPDGGDTAQAPAPEAGGAKYRIAVVPKGLTHQFWKTVQAGAQAAGREFQAEIIWNGPAKETDVDKQMSIIEDLVNSGINALVMAACHDEALVASVKMAHDSGIPVVTIDSGVKSDLPVSFVATDNVAGARAAGKLLVELVGGEGEVAIIPFIRGAATSDLRERGFTEALAEFPDITLLPPRYSNSEPAKGMAVTQDLLTASPNVKGIFAANEPGAIGAIRALKADGVVGEVKLIAFDASEDEIAALERGDVQALVVQNPFRMGYEGVKAAIDKLEGRPVEKRIDTGVTLVTQENFNEPDIQKLLYPLGK